MFRVVGLVEASPAFYCSDNKNYSPEKDGGAACRSKNKQNHRPPVPSPGARPVRDNNSGRPPAVGQASSGPSTCHCRADPGSGASREGRRWSGWAPRCRQLAITPRVDCGQWPPQPMPPVGAAARSGSHALGLGSRLTIRRRP